MSGFRIFKHSTKLAHPFLKRSPSLCAFLPRNRINHCTCLSFTTSRHHHEFSKQHSVVPHNKNVFYPLYQKRQFCEKRRTELSFEELQALIGSKDIKLIDVREPSELIEYGKIPNSINIPLGRLTEALKMSDESFAEIYKTDKPQLHDTNIVFYGLGPIKSTAALELAFKLGFKKARHYKGGWEEYSSRTGQPMKKTQ